MCEQEKIIAVATRKCITDIVSVFLSVYISNTEQDCYILWTASYFIRVVWLDWWTYTSLHCIFTNVPTLYSVDSDGCIFGSGITIEIFRSIFVRFPLNIFFSNEISCTTKMLMFLTHFQPSGSNVVSQIKNQIDSDFVGYQFSRCTQMTIRFSAEMRIESKNC